MVMYVMNYIDRNALPQARVQGLEEDLNLSGYEYNIVLSLTFIGYILMQGTLPLHDECFDWIPWPDTVQCPVICCSL
jgi:hypothetical protein